MRPNREQPRGMVLVLVLWALVVVAVLAAGLVQTAKLDNAMRVAAGDRVRARWLARAGAATAAAVLAADLGATDGPHDEWYENEKRFRNVALAGGTFTVLADRWESDDGTAGVMDEAAKLNVNTATSEELLGLPDMTEYLAERIIALRRSGVAAAESHGVRTAEADHVATWFESPLPTIRWLGWADGATEAVLYGEDRNLNGRLDSNEDDGDALPPPDNADGVLDRGLLAYITVYSFEWNVDGQGRPRININTADIPTLEDELGLSPEHAAWIETFRGDGFRCIAEILDDEAVVTARPRTPRRVAAPPEATTPPDEEMGAPIDPMPLDFEAFSAVADRLTVSDDEAIPGRINANTAGLEVLKTLPGVDAELAERWIAQRRELAEGFTSIAEVLGVPGMSVRIFKQMADRLTVRSNAFTIRSEGRAERTGLRHQVEVVFVRGPAGLSVLYYLEQR